MLIQGSACTYLHQKHWQLQHLCPNIWRNCVNGCGPAWGLLWRSVGWRLWMFPTKRHCDYKKVVFCFWKKGRLDSCLEVTLLCCCDKSEMPLRLSWGSRLTFHTLWLTSWNCFQQRGRLLFVEVGDKERIRSKKKYFRAKKCFIPPLLSVTEEHLQPVLSACLDKPTLLLSLCVCICR